MVKFFLLIIANFALLVGVLSIGGFRINLTPSQPVGLYKKMNGTWQKHDLVMSCLPEAAALMALERGYLSYSSVCDGHTPVIKQVMGVAGDDVEVTSELTINGEVVANSTIVDADDSGRALVAAKGGVTHDGEVWLISNHLETSYDARYFGPIDESYVLFRVKPVWTF